MGLDISAYSGIKMLETGINDEGEAIDCDGLWFTPWVNPNFPGRSNDVVSGAAYTYEHCIRHSIGYGRYYNWREKLAEIVGYPIAEYGEIEKCHIAGVLASNGGPFYELINFSDCEGVIGTEVSKKLAKDFAEFEGRAKVVSSEFYDLYLQWKVAFEMASNNGCIRLH